MTTHNLALQSSERAKNCFRSKYFDDDVEETLTLCSEFRKSRKRKVHSSETLEKQNQKKKIELHTAVKSSWIEAVVKMLSESCRIADSASSFKLWKHIAEKKSSYMREKKHRLNWNFEVKVYN